MQSLVGWTGGFLRAAFPTFRVVRDKHKFGTGKSAEHLWSSLVPPKKRSGGRGKRAVVRKRIDLGRNAVIGEGVQGMLWPGLNVPVSKNMRQRTEEEQTEYTQHVEEKKSQDRRPPRAKSRGWTGAQWGGVRLDPPNPVAGQDFSDFNCILMEVRRVAHRNKKVGRIYGIRAMVAVGNGRGIVGVGGCVASDLVSAVRKARIKAFNRLQYIDRCDERTVSEDLFTHHHRTWMSIRKQPIGYGLRCHRAVSEMCRLIGIKDLYVKTYGSTTMLNLLKCFMKGVRSQETYQQKADRLGYHVVEFDPLRHNYPVVLASPSSGRVNTNPNDELSEYMNQSLLLYDVLHMDESNWSSFYKAQAKDNRGVPVPRSQWVPDILTKLNELKL